MGICLQGRGDSLPAVVTALCDDLFSGTQYFPKTAVENLTNPFPVLTWHGVNMAEGLKALPSTYRFTHNQSGRLLQH